ncbi:hypothetical protein [Croceicoccus sp. YJ47]|uniref:hypothetical protein n=1 Tax=Croceicoccus sp. YJ47 TaxID=2798724 RepID=UPI00192367C0|nr:hypothetical protein [Croceicoccus sp. YJ47]QQN73974.1 hypothetical protein JD971_14695 [Croceicoccus sp. YJ47]
MAYAETTKVSFEKSISEIMALLRKAGADQLGQFEDRASFAVQFTLGDRMIKFRVPFVPDSDIPTKDGNGKTLTTAQSAAKTEQARRQRGRALLLTIKAKLESIESGIETFEQAFLANIVMSNGQTVHERIGGDLALEYKTGTPRMALLAGPSEGEA